MVDVLEKNNNINLCPSFAIPIVCEDIASPGAMASVKKCTCGDNEFVLKYAPATDSAKNTQLENETKVLQSLHRSKPHKYKKRIVEYLDGGKAHGFRWLAIPFAEGGSLASWWTKYNWTNQNAIGIRNDMNLLRHITKQIAEGLAFLESQNIVHRDIKPANILISCESSKCRSVDDVQVRIADFGTSSDSDDKTLASFGSPAYIPSERHLMDSPKRDVWTLAVILFDVARGFIVINDNRVSNSISGYWKSTTPVAKNLNNLHRQTDDDLKLLSLLKDILHSQLDALAVLRHPWLSHDSGVIRQKASINKGVKLPSVNKNYIKFYQ